MPCLNEAGTVESCIRKAQGFLESAGVSGEVIVADNGSTDGSQALAESLGARVVLVAAAVRRCAAGGFEAARGRYIVMGDSDDSYDFSALPRSSSASEQGTTSWSAIACGEASPRGRCPLSTGISATPFQPDRPRLLRRSGGRRLLRAARDEP